MPYIKVTSDPEEYTNQLAIEITDLAASIYEPVIIGLRLRIAELEQQLANLIAEGPQA